MTAPLTIYLPVRNGGDYLTAAIDSIAAQTDPEWRLVVLDNASTDDTRDRVRAYGDTRIDLRSADRSLSITDSWARILPLAAVLPRGTLISLIGHDDLLKPDFIALVKRLAKEDPTASLYQTQFEMIGGDGGIIRPARPVPLREEAGDLLAALCWGLRDSFGTGYAFRAEDYVEVGGIPPLPRLLYADHLLFTRLTARAHKRCASELGCSYRLHRGSASNGISALRLGDHALALDAFVAEVDTEFSDFAVSDRGRAALDRLLARELLILEAPGVRRALASSAAAAVKRLRVRFADGAIDDSALDKVRQWNVAFKLLRHQLGMGR
jgi:glycosyltransferase involved in cell wall biosynthesis